MTVANATDESLEALTVALGLRFESQDWGIANADGGRLGEFITYYERRERLAKPQRHALGELIVASMNDALERGEATASQVSVFEEFLARRQTDFPEVAEYWSCLDPDQFPVARFLRQPRSG